MVAVALGVVGGSEGGSEGGGGTETILTPAYTCVMHTVVHF